MMTSNHSRKEAMTTPSISVQLYSVKDALNTDLDGTLSKLASIGLRHVEAFDFVRRPAELRAGLDSHGLTAPTGHAFLVSDEVRRADGTVVRAPSNEETFAAAKQVGLETVIDPFVAPEKWTSVDDVRETAKKLNAAAAAAAAHGLTVGYHNHDHELRPRIDGRPSLEVLTDYLDQEVRLEVDLYWAAAAGVELVELLDQFGDRVVAVHVKDGTLGDHVGWGKMPTGQVAAGEGEVPLDSALAAARSIRYAVIEFDAYEGDVFDAIARSYGYLKQRGLA
jgi:sugar phosphate isomerase/epimerase